MKYTLSALLLIVTTVSIAQDLQTNPKTGLVWIHDSLDLKNSNLQEVKDYLTKWGRTLLDIDNLKAIYKLNNSRQSETVGINLPVGTVLTRELEGNRFSTNGIFSYAMAKTSGLNAFAPVVASGGVKFNLIYTITAKKLIYEFTNMEYSHDLVHYAKYEDEKPPKDNHNNSLWFNMGKKEWTKVRQEYYAKMQILAGNLKEYIANLIGNKPGQFEQSRVSYTTYQAIKTDMSFDEIKQLLGDEGKELSSSATQVNGKTVVQQTIVWHDLDNTKSITVTFLNGKVVSKSQTKL